MDRVLTPLRLPNGGACVVGFVHGSASSECSGFNIQVNFVVYVCLTVVREVAKPSDTCTANGNAEEAFCGFYPWSISPH